MHVLFLLIIVGGIGYAVYKLRATFGRSSQAPVDKNPPADSTKLHGGRPGRPEDQA